jgi:PAS domain S-box-containing protein
MKSTEQALLRTIEELQKENKVLKNRIKQSEEVPGKNAYTLDFRSFFQLFDGISVLFDLEGKVIIHSKQLFFNDYSDITSCQGTFIADLFNEEKHKPVETYFNSIQASGKSQYFRIDVSKGALQLWFGVKLVAMTDPNAKRYAYFLHAQDITSIVAKELEASEKGKNLELVKRKMSDYNQELLAKNRVLKETEERLELALEKTNTGFFDWYPHQDKAFFSRTWLSMLGYSKDDFAPSLSMWKELIHPDDLESMEAVMGNIIYKGDAPPSPELRFRCKDGSYKWLLVRGAPIEFSEDGKILRMIGIHTDITQQKYNEIELKEKHEEVLAAEEELRVINEELYEKVKALRTSEQRLNVALEKTNTGLFDWNAQTGESFYSATWATMLGYTSNEVETQNLDWHKLLHPDDKEEAIRIANEKVARSEDSFTMEFRLKAKDGNYRWVLSKVGVAEYDDDGKALRYVGTHNDITHLKNIELSLKEKHDEILAAEEELKTTNEELFESNMALQKSEDRYKKLADASFEGIAYSEDGIITELNHRFCELFGYEREELLGSLILTILAEEYHDLAIKHVLEMYHRPYEMEGVKKSGERFFIEVRERVVKQGEVYKVLSVIRDVTDRKKAEQSRERNEKQLQTIIDNSPIIMALVNKERRIIKLNNGTKGVDHLVTLNEGLTCLGNELSCAYLIRKDSECGEGVHCNACQLKQIIADTFANKTNHFKEEIEFNAFSNNVSFEYTYLLSTALIEDEEPRVLVSIDDVTKRKAYEREVNRNLERLERQLKISQLEAASSQELFDSAIDEAVMLTDSQFGYLFIYDRRRKCFDPHQRTEKNKANKRIASYATNDKVNSKGYIDEVFRKRSPLFISRPKADRNGDSELIVNSLVVPVFNENKVVAVAGVANKQQGYTELDEKQLSLLMNNIWKIVAKQQTYDELITAKEKAEESDRLKSAFLKNMSHEIRTPMNGIVGFSEMLTFPELEQEKRDSYVGIINQCSNQLLSTVEDIIKISTLDTHQETLNEEVVNLREMLKDFKVLYEPQAQKENIQLIVHALGDACNSLIETDGTKLRQILMNLIGNAMKFTQQGSVEVGCLLQDDFLKFFVKDTGIGIRKDLQEKVFDRFWQAETSKAAAKYGGLGLGLAICKAFVTLFGGDIWVESEYKKGTSFFFTIPYRPIVVNEQ